MFNQISKKTWDTALFILISIMLVVTVILEAIPVSICTRFTSGGTYIYKLYSYYDLTPFGYGDHTPFIMGVIAPLAVIFFALFYLTKKNWLIYSFFISECIIMIFTFIRFFLFETTSINVINFVLAVILVCLSIVFFVYRKKMKSHEEVSK